MVIAHGEFLEYDLPLRLKFGRIQIQVLHPVGLDVQGHVPAVRGEGEVVAGAVI